MFIAANSSGASAGIESVTVTATRSPQSPSELSSSVTVVDRRAIETVAPVHIAEILARVPGTWISRGNGQEHLTAIRSPVFTGAGSCGSFYMAEDGVPLRPSGFCNVNELFEVDATQAQQVDVLRGPGTVVHGGNALHGVINVINRAPALSGEAELALEAGPHDYLRLRGSISDRVETHAWRVNLTTAHDGGYKDDSGYEDYRFGWRDDVDGGDWQFASMLSVAKLQQETAGYIEGQDSYRNASSRRDNPNPEAFRDNTATRWHGRWSYNYAEGRHWVVTPFVRYQEMRFLQHFLPGAPLEENGATSAGWQSVHYWEGDSSWSTMAGWDGEWVDGYLQEFQPQPYLAIAGLPQGWHYDYAVTGYNTAVFASTSWQPSQALHLDAGLRGEHQLYQYDNQMISGATDAYGNSCLRNGVEIPCRYSRPSDRDDSFNNASADFGALWQVAQNHAFSGRIARAFRAPQASELYRLQAGQIVADLDSERADSLEFGWRGQWETWQAQLTAYAMQKENVIFQDSQRRNISGAETEHTGLEYSLEWQWASHWRVEMDGTLARHRYRDNPALSGLAASVQIEGNDMVTAPRTLASTRLVWLPPQWGSWELEWLHMGSYYLDSTNQHRYPGHELLNLRWRWQYSISMHIAARLLNVTDRDYAERADYAFGNYRYFVGEPRSLYVELAWKFN